MPPTLCSTCNRDSKKVNTSWSECSHVDCPNRRGSNLIYEARQKVNASQTIDTYADLFGIDPKLLLDDPYKD